MFEREGVRCRRGKCFSFFAEKKGKTLTPNTSTTTKKMMEKDPVKYDNHTYSLGL